MKSPLKILLLFFLFVSCSNGGDIGILGESPPVVRSEATYDVVFIDGDLDNSLIYGEGLSHSSWNSTDYTSMPLKLDAYVPVNAPENRPAILIIHGGGLQGGSRKAPQMVALSNYFAQRGWVAFSIDYRLEGDKGSTPAAWHDFSENNASSFADAMSVYPASRDAKAAVRWVYANADEYEINTGFIAACGGSAGAYLSVTLGVSEDVDFTNELSLDEDPSLSTTNLSQTSKIHSIIDFWGGGGHITGLYLVFGVQRFDATDAPILIVHGDSDPVVNFSQAEDLRDRYQATGADYEFHRLVGAGHGPWNATVDGMSLSELAADFIVRKQGLVVE